MSYNDLFFNVFTCFLNINKGVIYENLKELLFGVIHTQGTFVHKSMILAF